MDYLQLDFTVNGEARERLIAALSEAGCDAFEEKEENLLAFFAEDVFNETEVSSISTAFNLTYTIRHIQQQNWNAEWERSFDPVTVSGFCTVRASFHKPDTEVLHDIVITPKMSFGTGHHATTRLMIQAIRELNVTGRSLLDFGTGTGILAILASQCGATPVVAIDNDEWSVENTLENIQANNTASVKVMAGSLEVVTDSFFDIILANINRHILLQYMADMKKMLNPEGMLVVSGILLDDETIITEEALRHGLNKISLTTEGSWLCIIFTV